MESVRSCGCGPLHDPHATNQALSPAASRSKAEVVIFVAAVFELNRFHRARGTRRPAKRRSEASYFGAKAGGTSLGCKCEINCVGVWGLDWAKGHLKRRRKMGKLLNSVSMSRSKANAVIWRMGENRRTWCLRGVRRV